MRSKISVTKKVVRWLSLAPIAFMLHAPAQAETVARYGISMSDIPLTTGQPDRGAGAYQFTGHTIYDPLVAWEANISTRPGKLVPGLASSWKINPADNKKWLFTLRKGVKFHDGSDFKADAVIWNLEKVLNDKSPQFDPKQSAQVRSRIPSIASYKKVDDYTVEITTKEVDALFLYQLPWFLISSPAQWEKLGKDWNKFASQPSGTGPFKLDKLVPRERAELVKNAGYWDKTRLAKTDRIILIPIPDALTRTNALLNGQVDIIETPPPDALGQLKSAGFKLVSNVTPHVWPYHFSTLPGSPWTDIRVRKAANLAIDRNEVVALMNGLAVPAKGQVDATSPWFGKPTFQIKYDLPAARALMAQAGYSQAKPLKAKVIIAQGGTGQMLSLPMNEYIQQSLKEIGIQVEFEVVELESLYLNWRSGAASPGNVSKGISAINLGYVTADPFYAITRFANSKYVAPNGVNWSGYKNPEVDALISKISVTFDTKAQDSLLAQVHQTMVNDAMMLWVVHDTNPHVISPKVKSFVQAQHWFQDLTTIAM
ncbi:ABC transporter substrate-binding protein [Herbaspirillum sp. RTI4]|uniref:ABC transporter substrate-binding protein n=1 Tax=Herbaspirillum sp. RTI4 TaxID=3048640 RepID=UPI002AB5B7FA|nr:ABC transporter substrate-binding protein [Herbaspirillum sp. RTI4]MDY7579430.1 ABC transporter substrate-binding protein [Herbaspirillum sp. RTI4]MEA9980344.1 ABC transporter substrate-binding protein [Herbaspirillum sp. RTI4]